ncbi:MAG: transglycosylase family protein [Acidimicrobiales bacterium]
MARVATRGVCRATGPALAVLVVFTLTVLPVAPGAARGSALSLAALQEDTTVGGAEAAFQEAEAAFAAAEAEVARAETHRQELDAIAAEREVALRELDGATLTRVLAYESTLRRARDLAVDAYVRGGRQSELAVLMASEHGGEAMVGSQLLAGGVDQAADAAAALQSERVRLDRQVVQVGTDVAALRRELGMADSAVAAALTNRQQTYEALLAAIDRLATVEAAARAQAAAEQATSAADPSDEPPPTSSPPTRTAPPPPPPPAGDRLAEAWAKLRDCESGGDYQAIGGGGMYRGAYQFSQSTWESVGGTGDPAEATPEEQDYRAQLLYERSGSGQWPYCGRYLDEV